MPDGSSEQTVQDDRSDALRLRPPDAPIGRLELPELDAAREAMELGVREGELDLDALVRYRDLAFDHFRPDILPLLSWPRSWFIPQQADFRQHWPTPPPPSHRYDWTSTNRIDGGPSPSHASAVDGRLFAWGFATLPDRSTLGVARTGIFFEPSETLATYRLGADIDVTAEWRWALLPASTGVYGRVDYRCTVYLAVWQVNVVDGSWELVRPFGARTLVRTHSTGAGLAAVSRERHAFEDLRLDVQLQGGRTYAIGVSFEADVDAAIVDHSGRPYAKRPGDDVRLWASMLGVVPRITASRRVVWIP